MNTFALRCLVAAVLTAGVFLHGAPAHAQSGSDAIRQTLEQAREDGARSVTVHVQGSTLALLVTAIEGDHVVGRSAQHGRIVVRIDRIDAIAW